MSSAATKSVAPPAPEFNAADPRAVREREKASGDRQALKREGLRLVVSSQAGRAWLHAHLEGCGAFRSSFTGNSETFFREGERNVALRVLADLMRDHPDSYTLMCREASERGEQGYRAKNLKQPKNDTDETED
jgi:hypothetical protein